MLGRGVHVAEALLQNVPLVDCAAARVTEDLRHDLQSHFGAICADSAKLAELSNRQLLISAYCAPSLVVNVQRQIASGPKLEFQRAECALNGGASRHTGCAGAIAPTSRDFFLQECIQRASGDAQGEAGMFIGYETRDGNAIERSAPFREI